MSGYMRYLSRPKIRQIILLCLLAGAWLLLAWPSLRWLWSEWMGNDYYSHGVLVAPLALWLAWHHWPQEGKRGSPWGGLFLMVGALLLYLWWSHSQTYYLSDVALLLLLAGIGWYLAGRRALSHLTLPLLLLLLADPFPFVAGSSVPLSLFTGQLATQLVQLFGISAVVQGAEVTLPNVSLVVGAQCSGVNSIVALTTLALLLAFLFCWRWWKRSLILLSAIPVAVLGNIARVASLLAVANVWGADAGFKFYHDYSGFVFFLTALAILFVLLKGLRCRKLNAEYF